MQTKDDAMVPLSVTCWPTQSSSDAVDVTLEYELNKDIELHDLLVSIPIPADASHTITSAEVGQASKPSPYVWEEATYSRREGMLQWSVPIVDQSNSSATMEFSVSAVSSADVIFPISVNFSSRKTMCELEVNDVLSVDDNSSIPYSASTLLSIESYIIS
ncbi:MAG: hypothetical protein SGPRY_010404 [Prymnesium sp.]